MTYDEFKTSLHGQYPPSKLSVHQEALWYDAKGIWKKAHELIQDNSDKNSAWIHAYLHRKEGDFYNADYWYRKARKNRPQVTLEDEWEDIAKALLL